MAKYNKNVEQGYNFAMKNPTKKKKKKKYVSSYFSYLFHISNFKILPLTVLDRMQNVTHGRTHGRTHGQAQTNMPPQLLRSWGHKKDKCIYTC